MHIEALRAYCIQKNGVTEDFPFDANILVFKVMGKLFALTGLDSDPFRFNLKCNPDWAIELRELYTEIQPGYHMNKKHWNTVIPEGLPPALVRKMIDHSYELVVSGLSRALKSELESL